MTETIFFRLLKTPIDNKGNTFAGQIADLNTAKESQETYILNPMDFTLIYGSPFAY